LQLIQEGIRSLLQAENGGKAVVAKPKTVKKQVHAENASLTIVAPLLRCMPFRLGIYRI